MPTFSQVSEDKLALAHQDLQVLFNTVIETYDCTVATTYITKVEAEHDFDIGASTIHYPTKHNSKPSIAADVVPYIEGNISYDEKQDLHFAGFIEGIATQLYSEGKMQHKLRCGSNWKGDHIFIGDIYAKRFKDPCHFELVLNPGEVIQYFET